MSANILGCKDRDVLEISNRESMFFFKLIPAPYLLRTKSVYAPY